MVRLEVLPTLGQLSDISLFQFQNGTIRSAAAMFRLIPHLHFNSKMVRLEVNGGSKDDNFNIFQFQNGTIRSPLEKRAKAKIITFQFQNGTIRSSKCQIIPQIPWLISIPKWYD